MQPLSTRTNELDRFKLDRLKSNCDYIVSFCRSNENEPNKSIIENCDQLIKSADYVNKFAYDYVFDKIPTNGFILYLKVITAYTQKIVNHLKKQNKFDKQFVKIFKIILNYKDLLLYIHERLVSEEKEIGPQKNGKSLRLRQSILGDEIIYDLIHSNGDLVAISISKYPGFWLPKHIQRLFKVFNFCFALAYKVPASTTTLYSSKNVGRYCYKAFRNATLDYPFDMWHQPEGFFISKFLNSIVNIGIPVRSVTLQIPKQYRYRIDYKGNLLDFYGMNRDEIENYFNDKDEQERQNHPGKRHRNKESIECRYSFISDKENIIKSLNEIKIQDRKYPNINVYSTSNQSHNYGEQTFENQVPQLNIYEPTDLIKSKLNMNRKKIKNLKYDGPRYLNESKDELKDIPLQNDSSAEKFDLNPEKCLIMYVHGGGFATQGPRSCELFLRSIVNTLGGIPTLAIHYSLTVPFPVFIQEILDVYLWVLSGDEDVKRCLGYHPKKIICLGDSAGGYLTMSLLVILNELNIKYNIKIPLPKSLVSCYPVYDISNFSASRALSPTLEPLIAFHPLLVVCSLLATNKTNLGEFKKLETEGDERYKMIKESNKHLVNDKTYKFKENDKLPFFHCDYLTYKNRCDYLKSFSQNEIFTPITYKNFDGLKDVDLYTITGELDFLSDDSLEISRIWKGNYKLDIINDLMHGFLYFGGLSPICDDAIKLTISRLQEACGLS